MLSSPRLLSAVDSGPDKSTNSTTIGPMSYCDIIEKGEDTSIQAMGYYDIMILGISGQGKTTTAEKLLIANPTGVNYGLFKGKDSSMEDLSAWFISSDENSLERTSTRMKNLSFYRTLDNPHLEINAAHESNMQINQGTVSCELFSNDTTKIRVLDVPGFFGITDQDSMFSRGVTASDATAHISTMRNILQIQNVMAMKFKRILYFLPCRGPLKIISAALCQELQLLIHYFGISIFQTIVVVATLDHECLPVGKDVLFPQDKLDDSRRMFKEALQSFLPEDTPNPPIIFISLWETCESLLKKVQEVDVGNSGSLNFQFSSLTVCCRCSMFIEKRNGRLACTHGNKWSELILYEDSHCHPFFVPKYTKWKKITHTVSSFILGEKEYPDFGEEICHNCGAPPGTPGCLLVGSKYSADEKSFIIDHDSLVDEFANSHRVHRAAFEEGLLSQRVVTVGASAPFSMGGARDSAYIRTSVSLSQLESGQVNI